MQLYTHYFLVLLILTVYGGQVCPFLASLSTFHLGLFLAISLSLQLILHKIYISKYIFKVAYPKQSKHVFLTVLSLFFSFGILQALYTTLVIGFPFFSGLKLTLGMLTLGYFIAADLSLKHELSLAQYFQKTGYYLEHPETHFFPLTRKFALFASISSFFSIGIFFLVVNKDLGWMIQVGEEIGIARARLLILLEVSFVILILLGYVLKIIFSYSRNLQFFFENENNALSRTTSGKLDSFVPVSSSDEFGIMASRTNQMIKNLKDKNEELQRTQDVTIYTLTSLAETRDNETGAHILRTQRYVRSLAESLEHTAGFENELNEETIDLLFKSAPLHDIGKVGIPDAILLKPDKLNSEEWETMKTHAALGGDALYNAEKRLGSTSFLRIGREIAYTHHEKWDGNGYPKGLSGEDIPVSGRLMALADVYDALVSKRVYKPAFSHDKAKSIILEGRGQHFDPRVVDAFLEKEQEFVNISVNFKD